MDYILKASTKAFIVVLSNNEYMITPDYTIATKYSTLGEAMKEAAKLNGILCSYIVKAVPYEG